MGLSDKINSAQVAYKHLHQATIGIMAVQKIAQRDYEQAQVEANKWEKLHQLALKEGREDLACKAQFQKERYKAIACKLKILLDQQAPQVDSIKRNLACYKRKFTETHKKVLSSQPSESSAVVSQRNDAKVSSEGIASDNLEVEDFDEILARLKADLKSLFESQQRAIDVKESKRMSL